MRPIVEWDETDLRALIANDVQESLELDYKRSDALGRTDGKKSEISKDVSAFANSAGGRIVYGIVEDEHHPVDLDQGADLAQTNREWLEQVIASTITPRVAGVTIKQIDVAPGRAAFVVEVPQARSGGPHQANDKRYYRRQNFRSVPMEDYEVRDVLNRFTSPDLQLRWDILNHRPTADTIIVEIDLTMRNQSSQPALYTSVSLFLDEDLDASLTGAFARVELRRVPDGRARYVHVSRLFAVPADQPFYRELDVTLGTLTVNIMPNILYPIGQLVSSPGFSRRQMGAITWRGRPVIEWDR